MQMADGWSYLLVPVKLLSNVSPEAIGVFNGTLVHLLILLPVLHKGSEVGVVGWGNVGVCHKSSSYWLNGSEGLGLCLGVAICLQQRQPTRGG